MTYIILGGGGVVAEYYLPALTMMGLADRTVVVDPFEHSLAPLRSAFSDVRLVAQDHVSFLAGLSRGGEERIIVALPNHLHVEAVEAALKADRHVLCEKPLALKAQDCFRLAALATEKGRLLKVAMSRRYLSSLMLARQIVTGGELGRIQAVDVRDCAAFRWKPRSFAFFNPESGGVLADMGVHYLDFLDMIVGPMTPLSYSNDAQGGTESVVTYELKAGPVPVTLRLSRLHDARSFVRIVCEKGTITVDKASETGLTIAPTAGPLRTVLLEHPFENPTWPADFHGSFCQMLSDFERAIAGACTPIADVSDASRVTALIEWAYARRGVPRPAKVRDRATVLVTGGTGFIGGHLVEHLTASDTVNVRVAVRSPTSCANISRFPVEMLPTDLLNPESVAAGVAGTRTIYHLAYGKEADASRITFEGTKNVVEAGIAAGTDCIVILSTMYVYGFPVANAPVDETAPYRPYGGEYAESKAAMERWSLERARTSGKTRIVILNPTCVFGPEGGAYTALPVDLARDGRFSWISGGNGICNYTYVGNVVDAIMAAAVTPAAHGDRFLITDGHMTWRQFLGPLLVPLGRAIPDLTPAQLRRLRRFGPPFRWRDLFRAAIAAGEIRAVAKRSAWVRRYFSALQDGSALRPTFDEQMGFRHALASDARQVFAPEWLAELYPDTRTVFSAEKARAVLKWTPALSWDQALNKTVCWLTDTGHYD
jgi:predicted dehydrogenase/nucleoside-diphosphate-sugar epimerase